MHGGGAEVEAVTALHCTDYTRARLVLPAKERRRAFWQGRGITGGMAVMTMIFNGVPTRPYKFPPNLHGMTFS